MSLLTDLLATPRPFALIRRENADHLDLYAGTVTTVDRLADIPLPPGPAGPRTLALLPYRQVGERGFAHVDDGAPLECLVIQEVDRVPLDAVPTGPVRTSGPRGFDVDDAAYAEVVERVLGEEIGRGEGANFVIHRVFTARVDGDPLTAGLAALGNLLATERGAYWTFLVHTGARTLVGATPERHVSVEDGLVMMNPISGTFRHDGDLLAFLADPKEVDELYMVLDEELKMMATVADHGGQVVGPYLKEMAHLTHTEYLLAGRGSRDVREVLRESMFAPTVTGSPIENACRVIARHERRGRGYYGGVLALLGTDDAGRQTLDAPILIRTAELTPDGHLRVPVGATLVRHSTPDGEVAETHAKAAGVLGALGLGSGPAGRGPSARADDPAVQAALAARNDHLARFWLDAHPRPEALAVPALAGCTALVVDGEDTFTGMLAHQLRALGLAVEVARWDTAFDAGRADLLVVGPGPGDPTSTQDPKMASLRAQLVARLGAGAPLLAICLGHQLLAGLLGLPPHRRDAPYQGVQRVVDLFGVPRRVGFYSTYTARSAAATVDSAYGRVALARDPDDGTVHALRGPGFAGLQFHPESVLSEDGLAVLAELVPALIREAAATEPA